MRDNPRISVLLPLQDERQAGVDSMRAWTAQRVDPGSFEIVALAPGENRSLERSVRPLLREQDRWVDGPGMDEYELFNLGARQARGQFIFITEAHCVPESDCLAAMLEELERTGAPGVRGRSVPETVGPLGELESQEFEDALRVEEDPHHWRKILIHSLAIRRELYLQAGGLPPAYGDFAPWPLAIALHSRGNRLVFSPRPRVRHVYDGDLRQLGSHVRSFGRGEMLYRSRTSSYVGSRYLDPAVEWEQRLAHTRGGAVRALRAAAVLRHRGTWHEALRHLAVAMAGPRLPITRARLGAALAARRARRGRDLDRVRHQFREFWRLTSRRGRLEGLREAGEGEAPAPPPVSRVEMSESFAGRSVGLFHAEEAPEGGIFRWTAPLAILKLNAPGSGTVRARIELVPIERPADAQPAEPRVAVGWRSVEASWRGDAIEFEMPAGEHWISIACKPLRPGRHGVDDPRALGLPLRAIRFEPAGAPA